MNSKREWELLGALVDGEVDESLRLFLLASMNLDVAMQSRFRRLELLCAWTRRGAKRHRAPRALQRRIRRERRRSHGGACARRLLAAWQRLRGRRHGDALRLEERSPPATHPGGAD